MKIIAVDDEQIQLNLLQRAITTADPNAEVKGFTKASDLISFIEEKQFCPDVVFLDIEMPGKSGIELGNLIKQINKKVNIVFVTGYSEYTHDAINMRVSGYIMKPITADKIRTELLNLRNPVETNIIRVHCFGSFEVFVNEIPVHFSRSLSKEILAYLVDRCGASCTAAEIAAVIWEDGLYDRSRQKHYSLIKSSLIKDLKTVGAEKMIISNKDVFAVNKAEFECDYYKALEGDEKAIHSFMGEYMSNYSWSEFRLGALERKFL